MNSYLTGLCVYKRNALVLSNSHVLRHVFDFTIDGVKQEGNKSYCKKALIWIAPQNMVFSKENCIFLMEEYFSLCQQAGTIIETNRPSFNDNTDYHEASHWMKYASVIDLVKIFEISQVSQAFPNLTTFFKSSKNNLYSCIQEGLAKMEFFRMFDLKDCKYLLPEDITRIQTFFPDSIDAPVVTPVATPNGKEYASTTLSSEEFGNTARTLDYSGTTTVSFFICTFTFTLPFKPTHVYSTEKAYHYRRHQQKQQKIEGIGVFRTSRSISYLFVFLKAPPVIHQHIHNTNTNMHQ